MKRAITEQDRLVDVAHGRLVRRSLKSRYTAKVGYEIRTKLCNRKNGWEELEGLNHGTQAEQTRTYLTSERLQVKPIPQ